MSCGHCTFCCRSMAVRELAKPVDVLCTHCTPGVGCNVYANRPPSCADFMCYWRSTQDSPIPANVMPPIFRPDRCRVMIADHTEKIVVAKVDPREPMAFTRQPMFTFLYMRALSARVYVVAGKRVFQVFMGGTYSELPSTDINFDAEGNLSVAIVEVGHNE